MKKYRNGLLIIIISAWILTGCEILRAIEESVIEGGPLSRFRLITLDLVNDTSSTTGNHSILSYHSDGTLDSIVTYYGPLAGPHTSPVETRDFDYVSSEKTVVHITETGETDSDSTYIYNSDSVLIMVGYSKGSEEEKDTLELDSDGNALKTTHYSKGTATRLVKHTSDSATGNVLIDSLFTLPAMDIIGVIEYSYSTVDLTSEQKKYQLSRGSLKHYRTEKYTYDSAGRLLSWKEFNAGGDVKLLESITLFYNADTLVERALKVDELASIVLQEARFAWEAKPSPGLVKRGVNTSSESNLINQITLGNSLGLSTKMLSDWESLYNQQEVEK